MWSTVKSNLPMIIGMALAGATLNAIALAIVGGLILCSFLPAREQAPAKPKPSTRVETVPNVRLGTWFDFPWWQAALPLAVILFLLVIRAF